MNRLLQHFASPPSDRNEFTASNDQESGKDVASLFSKDVNEAIFSHASSVHTFPDQHRQVAHDMDGLRLDENVSQPIMQSDTNLENESGRDDVTCLFAQECSDEEQGRDLFSFPASLAQTNFEKVNIDENASEIDKCFAAKDATAEYDTVDLDGDDSIVKTLPAISPDTSSWFASSNKEETGKDLVMFPASCPSMIKSADNQIGSVHSSDASFNMRNTRQHTNNTEIVDNALMTRQNANLEDVHEFTKGRGENVCAENAVDVRKSENIPLHFNTRIAENFANDSIPCKSLEFSDEEEFSHVLGTERTPSEGRSSNAECIDDQTIRIHLASSEQEISNEASNMHDLYPTSNLQDMSMSAVENDERGAVDEHTNTGSSQDSIQAEIEEIIQPYKQSVARLEKEKKELSDLLKRNAEILINMENKVKVLEQCLSSYQQQNNQLRKLFTIDLDKEPAFGI